MNKRMIAVVTAALALQSLAAPAVFAESNNLSQESSNQEVYNVSGEEAEQELTNEELTDSSIKIDEESEITTSPMIEVDIDSDFTYEIVNGEAKHVKFIGEVPTDGKVTFPNEIKGYPVTSIGSFALLDINDRTDYTVDFCTRTDLVTEVVLPDTVKEIEDYAFLNCNKLQNINVPNALEKIGKQAFVYDYDIKSLDFSQTNLKSIDGQGLWAMTGLESLILPDCFEQFGEYALGFTSELGDLDLSHTSLRSLPEGILVETGAENIYFPTTLTTLGRGCFNEAKRLKVLDLSMTQLKSTNKNLIDSCPSVEKVLFPETLERIDLRACCNCPQLVETNLDKLPKLNLIDNYAFMYDSKLALTALPEGLATVKNSVFRYCDSIKDLAVPASFVKGTDADCFPEQAVLHVKSGSYGLEYAQKNNYQYVDESLYSYDVENGEARSVKYIGEIPADGKVVFPGTLEGYPVASVGSFALLDIAERSDYTTDFCTRTDLVTEVVLPDTVKEIEDYAFLNCNKIQKINAPSALEKIGTQAFVFNYDIKTLDFSQTNLKSIGGQALWAMTSLETLILPDCFEELGEYALGFTSELGDLDLSHTSLKSLPEGVLVETGVENIYFPATLTTLGRGCFNEAKRLKVLDLSMTQIKNTNRNLIDSCPTVEKILFPETLETIDNRACFDCPQLVETNIDKLPKLRSIGNYAFMYDKKLNLTALPEKLATLSPSVFRYCDSIKDLAVPASFVKGGDAECFPEQAVLHVKENSYGLEYAQKNNYEYVIEK